MPSRVLIGEPLAAAVRSNAPQTISVRYCSQQKLVGEILGSLEEEKLC
jgi:hypothetical protein